MTSNLFRRPMLPTRRFGSKLLTAATLAGAVLAGTVLGIDPAAAQMGAPKPGAPVVPTAEAPASRRPAPPALPGARTSEASAVAPDRPPSEMSPNEALFDAINRGDIGNVRDAISRGAELDQQNMLGLTPIDLSVDLGRNDITFLLLSMRAAASTGGPPRAAAQAVKPGARGQSVAANQARPAARAPAAPRALAVSAEAPPANRQYVSRDPGTPAPQAGFLGFSGAPGR